MKNRFSILQDEQELKSDSFNQPLKEASKKISGYRRKKKRDWISLDTWGSIDKRRKAKKKLLEAKSQRLKEQLQTKHSELDREVKKKARADKKALTQKLAHDAEEAAQKQDMATQDHVLFIVYPIRFV